MRFLLLLMLSMVLLSGAAYAQDSWALVDQNIAGVLTWEEVADTSVTANNDSATDWDSTYSLESVEGITPSATAIDRWGNSSVDVSGTVLAGDDYTFGFYVVAPPITTLMYPDPEIPTAPGVIAGFDNNWVMANSGSLIQTDEAVQSTVIERFPDIGPDEASPQSYAYAFQIEQLGGRVPMIAQGFADDTYRPLAVVNRGAMAVYIQRSLAFPLGTYDGRFTDVPLDFPQAPSIMSCVNNGIVQGYSDNTYHPERTVTRGQMAIFVARGMAGGDDYVPSGPSTPSFTDVATTDQPYKYVEYAVAEDVVQGYSDDTYRPANPVTRGQMAVYIYRAFIQPTGAIVVLAGPAMTEVDTSTVTYDGWSSAGVVSGTASVTAYVGFDALRFKDDQPDFDVTFELYDTIPPSGTPIAEQTVTVDVSAALAAATGDRPYAYATWDIPTGLSDGQYALVTTVNGEELERQPILSVGASGPLTGSFDKAAIIAATWDMVSDRIVDSGSDADLAESDDSYLVTIRDTLPDWRIPQDPDPWCSGVHATSLIWKNIPTDATSLELTLEYHVVQPNDGTWNGSDPVDTTGCCATNCCDEWGTLDPAWALTLGDPPGSSPVVHTPLYTYTNDPTNAPLGWGLSVETGDFDAGSDWWDTDAYDLNDDGDDDFWVLTGSGVATSPSPRDIPGGGDMYTGQSGFTGFARDTDVVEVWGTTNPAGYLNANGDFVISFCGGSIHYLYIDQAVVTYTR